MFATFALFTWPVVVLILFRTQQRPLAVILSLLGGYLLLPVRGGIDLPLLPALEKFSIPALAVLAIALISRPRPDDPPARPGLLPKGFLPRALLLSVVVGAFMTVFTNGDTLVYGPLVLPALRTYDAFSAILTTVILLLPMLLARKFLAHPREQRLLLVALCISGLLYSLLALFEVRMSPQLNQMIYGFFPHSWIQHVRGGGYRPVVFLSHGLQLAIFFAGTIMAAVALMRMNTDRKRLNYLLAALWLFMTLILAKSLGALAIALLLTPAILFFGTRVQLLIAAIAVILTVSYPISRGAGWVPVEWIYSTASEYDAARGASLQTRLVNEEELLAKASERPVFGWGAWGRNRVYDERGVNRSITDGYWVIAIGAGGWIRFLTEFLLLGAPAVLLFLRRKKFEIGMETSALAVILAAWMVDLLPNSALTVPLWMIAGALWGRLELARVSDTAAPDPVAVQTKGLTYTRMPHKFRGKDPKKRPPESIPAARHARRHRLSDARSS